MLTKLPSKGNFETHKLLMQFYVFTTKQLLSSLVCVFTTIQALSIDPETQHVDSRIQFHFK